MTTTDQLVTLPPPATGGLVHIVERAYPKTGRARVACGRVVRRETAPREETTVITCSTCRRKDRPVTTFAPELIALPLRDRALVLASRAHAGQRDKAGVDYLTAHVYDVARRVAGTTPGLAPPLADSDGVVTVALLHDVLEDTGVTEDQLRALFPAIIVDAVVALTRVAGEDPDDYYARVRANPLALQVKAADIDSNTDPERMALLAAPVRERLVAKYDYARRALGLGCGYCGSDHIGLCDEYDEV